MRARYSSYVGDVSALQQICVTIADGIDVVLLVAGGFSSRWSLTRFTLTLALAVGRAGIGATLRVYSIETGIELCIAGAFIGSRIHVVAAWQPDHRFIIVSSGRRVEVPSLPNRQPSSIGSHHILMQVLRLQTAKDGVHTGSTTLCQLHAFTARHWVMDACLLAGPGSEEPTHAVLAMSDNSAEVWVLATGQASPRSAHCLLRVECSTRAMLYSVALMADSQQGVLEIWVAAGELPAAPAQPPNTAWPV